MLLNVPIGMEVSVQVFKIVYDYDIDILNLFSLDITISTWYFWLSICGYYLRKIFIIVS